MYHFLHDQDDKKLSLPFDQEVSNTAALSFGPYQIDEKLHHLRMPLPIEVLYISKIFLSIFFPITICIFAYSVSKMKLVKEAVSCPSQETIILSSASRRLFPLPFL